MDRIKNVSDNISASECLFTHFADQIYVFCNLSKQKKHELWQNDVIKGSILVKGKYLHISKKSK